MSLQIICGDLFEAEADAILLTADLRGIESSLGGANLASAFRRRWPETWEDVEAEVLTERERRGPANITSGEVFAARVSDCPFTYVFVANSLPHIGSREERPDSVSRAVEDAAAMARQREVHVLAAPLMVGGWRLTPERALEAMLVGFRRALARCAPNPLGVDLHICNLNPSLCDQMKARLARGA